MLLDKVKHILCISLILLVGVTTLYACKSDDKELQGEPVLQVQKSIGFKKEGGEVAVPVKSNREWNASVTEGKRMADGKESIGYRTDGFGNIQSRKRSQRRKYYYRQ